MSNDPTKEPVKSDADRKREEEERKNADQLQPGQTRQDPSTQKRR